MLGTVQVFIIKYEDVTKESGLPGLSLSPVSTSAAFTAFFQVVFYCRIDLLHLTSLGLNELDGLCTNQPTNYIKIPPTNKCGEGSCLHTSKAQIP